MMWSKCLLMWMLSALGVVVARMRNLVACVSAAGVFITLRRPMFWHLLPAPVIQDRVYRRPAISSDEWLDKKELFDQTEGD